MQAQNVELTAQNTDRWQSQNPDNSVSDESSDWLYSVGQNILDGAVEVLDVTVEATEKSLDDIALIGAVWGVLARRTQKKKIRDQIALGHEQLNLVADLLGDTIRQERLQRAGIFEPLRDTYKKLLRRGFQLEAQLEQQKFYNVMTKYTLFKTTHLWVRNTRSHQGTVMRKSAWVMVGLALQDGEIPMETPQLTPQRAALTSPSDLTLAAPPTVIGGESAGGTSVELFMFGRRCGAKAASGQRSDSDSDDPDDETDYVFDKEPVEAFNMRTVGAVDEATRIDKGKGRAVDE